MFFICLNSVENVRGILVKFWPFELPRQSTPLANDLSAVDNQQHPCKEGKTDSPPLHCTRTALGTIKSVKNQSADGEICTVNDEFVVCNADVVGTSNISNSGVYIHSARSSTLNW